jgi:hypothetical protein
MRKILRREQAFFINFIYMIFPGAIRTKMYTADDTSLYCIVDDQNETAESLNSVLNSLSTWASDWCVNFNASKTKPIVSSCAKY